MLRAKLSNNTMHLHFVQFSQLYKIGYTNALFTMNFSCVNIGARKTDDSPVLVKNVRLDIPRLNSGEEVVLLIMPGLNGEQLNNELVGFMKSSGIQEIPFVSFVRSEHGNGENLTNSINREVEKSIKSTAKAAAD